MSTKEKLMDRVLSNPSDLTYDELVQFLNCFGLLKRKSGKTSGSRVRYYDPKTGFAVKVHKPHGTNRVGKDTLRNILDSLKEGGYL